MKTKAVRLYGAFDLRTEEFELPEIKDDEILVKVVSDSICMSTYKCACLGKAHKRVPDNIETHPTIMGHEFAGEIVKVGKLHQDKFKPGMKFAQQPALNYKGSMWSPGYSYEFFGGDATYCIIPPEVMELGCLMEYNGRAYYEASLAEPMSCCVGAVHACFHTTMGSYVHEMGPKKEGKMLLLAAAGPMGLGTIDYVLHSGNQPKVLVVADINSERLERARRLFPEAEAAELGTTLVYVNTADTEDPAKALHEISKAGYDDVFVFTPVASVCELASKVLGRDGCINFFAGPTDTEFSAMLNYYDIHYNSTHVIGTTGGNTDDLKESLRLSAEGNINPAVMVTHIGGLNAAAETTLNLPKIPGGKKLIYNHIEMPLTAIEDFAEIGKKDERFKRLAEIVEEHRGLWCPEAEEYLLQNW